MNILVYAHRLEVGGTQVNAIELSTVLRNYYGHRVTILAAPGPMQRLVAAKGLKFIEAPDAHRHPSARRMAALRSAVRTERPDIVHAWDWWQCLDTYFGAHLPLGIPMAVTDMSMTVARFLPKMVPMTFGTPDLVAQARLAGRRYTELLPPPVDVNFNMPGSVDGRRFRRQYGVSDDEVLIVTVSRLSTWLKAESLFQTLSAVRTLAKDLPIRFVLVGDGELRARLQSIGESINSDHGRVVASFAGPLLDPREAYAAADLVIGMGGSALRAMAFGKPVIVAGERGFADAVTPETAERFYHTGMYGIGCDADDARLTGMIRLYAGDRSRLHRAGKFSRQYVIEHFALERVASKLETFLAAAMIHQTSTSQRATDAARTGAVLLGGSLLKPFRTGPQASKSTVRKGSSPVNYSA